MVSTHSPYIVNHLNVLLRAGYFEKARENYPFLEKDDIAVYRVMKENHFTDGYRQRYGRICNQRT